MMGPRECDMRVGGMTKILYHIMSNFVLQWYYIIYTLDIKPHFNFFKIADVTVKEV